jgi:hypothetical protein
MSPIWNGRVAWWTYLIAVIDILNIGFNAREPRWDRMGAHAARLLGDGAGGLVSVYSDHELFRSVQAILTRSP